VYPPFSTLAALVALAAPGTASASTGVAAVERTRDILYGKDPVLQALDVYRPENAVGALPVLVFVHGGGWSMGGKGTRPAIAAFFGHADLVYVTINYRLSPAVKHPAHADDVARAVAWVHANIHRYGGDGSSIYLMGHSAGAHLAALVASTPRHLRAFGVPPEIIRGTILLDGSAYDLVKRVPESGGWVRKMLLNAFGNDPTVWRGASPQHQLSGDGPPPPCLLFHVSGRRASETQARSFAAALRAAGGKAEVIAVADRTHTSIYDLVGSASDPVGPRIVEFIRSRSAGNPVGPATPAAPSSP
jgi:arylformamidase